MTMKIQNHEKTFHGGGLIIQPTEVLWSLGLKAVRITNDSTKMLERCRGGAVGIYLGRGWILTRRRFRGAKQKCPAGGFYGALMIVAPEITPMD